MKYKNKYNLKRPYVSSNFHNLREKYEDNINTLEGKEKLLNRLVQNE